MTNPTLTLQISAPTARAELLALQQAALGLKAALLELNSVKTSSALGNAELRQALKAREMELAQSNARMAQTAVGSNAKLTELAAKHEETLKTIKAKGEADRVALTRRGSREQEAVLAASHRKQEADAVRSAHVQADAAGINRSLFRGAAIAGGAGYLSWGASIPAIAGGFATGAAIKESISTGAEFQKQMAFVKIASEDSAAAVAGVAENIRKLGGETLFGPIEMAKGMRALAQAGFDTRTAFETLPSVLNLAALGEQTVGQAAETAQGLMHAFGLTANDVQHIGDVLARSANLSATNVGEMSQAMRQASSIAQQFNVNIDEMGGLLAILAQRNIRGSAAGTSLMNMFREFDPKSADAIKAFRALKVEINTSDSAIDRLMKLSAAFARFDKDSQNRLAMDYSNIRGAKGLFAIFAGLESGDLQKFVQANRTASEGVGYLKNSVKDLEETLSGVWAKFKGAAESAGIEAFKGSAGNLAEAMTNLIGVLTSDAFQTGLTALVKLFTTVAEGYAKLTALGVFAIQGPAQMFNGGPNPFDAKDVAAKQQTLADINDQLAKKTDPRADTSSRLERWLDQWLGWRKDTITPALLARKKELETALRAAGLSTGDAWEDAWARETGRYSKGDLGTVLPAKKGGKSNYTRTNLDDEAIKRARFNLQIEAVREAQAMDELQDRNARTLLDQRHKYQLTSEAEYIAGIDAMEDARIAREQARLDSEVPMLEKRIRAMKRGQDQDAEQLKLNKLLHDQEMLSEKAAFNKQLRAGRVEGEGALRDRAVASMGAGIDADLRKVIDKEALRRQGDRIGIENAVLPQDVAIRYTAQQQAQAAYLSEFEKLQKARDEAAAKAAQGLPLAKQEFALLEEKIAKLPQLREAQARLNEQEGLANYNRQREFSYGWDEAFKSYADNATNAAQKARDEFTLATRTMEDASVQFITTQKIGWRQLADTAVAEMARMQVRPGISAGLGLLKSWLTPAQQSIGWDGAAVMTAVDHAGGVAGLEASSYRRVDPAVFAGASRFHTGGLVGGEVPVIARYGEGIFTPAQMRALAPAKGAAPKLAISFTNPPGQNLQAKQSGPAVFDGEQYIINVVLSAVENQPGVRNALSGAFR